MINSIRELLYYIESDVKATGKKLGFWAFFFRPIFRFIFLMRVNEFLLNKKIILVLRIIPLLWYRRLGTRLGFSIPLNVFGPGLAIVHYGLLVVSPMAKIGKNCRIHAGVNIGGAAGIVSNGQDCKAPVLGDNCYIGPGAKIFGDIIIGDDCVIGANSVVNKSFPGNSISIAGVPARKISNKGSQGTIVR